MYQEEREGEREQVRRKREREIELNLRCYTRRENESRGLQRDVEVCKLLFYGKTIFITCRTRQGAINEESNDVGEVCRISFNEYSVVEEKR